MLQPIILVLHSSRSPILLAFSYDERHEILFLLLLLRIFAGVIEQWQKIKEIFYLDFHFLEKREGHDGMLKFQGEDVIKILMTHQQCKDHNIQTLQLL